MFQDAAYDTPKPSQRQASAPVAAAGRHRPPPNSSFFRQAANPIITRDDRTGLQIQSQRIVSKLYQIGDKKIYAITKNEIIIAELSPREQMYVLSKSTQTLK